MIFKFYTHYVFAILSHYYYFLFGWSAKVFLDHHIFTLNILSNFQTAIQLRSILTALKLSLLRPIHIPHVNARKNAASWRTSTHVDVRHDAAMLRRKRRRNQTSFDLCVMRRTSTRVDVRYANGPLGYGFLPDWVISIEFFPMNTDTSYCGAKDIR